MPGPRKPPQPPKPAPKGGSNFEAPAPPKKAPVRLEDVAPDVGMDTKPSGELGVFSVVALQRQTGSHRIPRKDGLLPPERDLKPGDTGQEVLLLQRCLVALGDLKEAQQRGEASRFGPATAAALRAFQLRTKLHPSGTYTAFTRGALQKALDEQPD